MKTEVARSHTWYAHRGQLGEWDWYFDLPTGWCAAVHDDSQVCGASYRPTYYRISAICTHWIREGKQTFSTLEEAKNAALRFTMDQFDECGGPGSPVHYALDKQCSILTEGEKL